MKLWSLARGSKNSSENREGGAGKSGTEQEQRISTKANPAPKSSQKASKQKNIKTFDPFSKCFNSPKRNQRILAPIRLRKKKSGGLRKKLLNPYSKEAINQSQKTGKKKLDRLKKLVSAEEQTPAHSTSLRDYCREYLDKPRLVKHNFYCM